MQQQEERQCISEQEAKAKVPTKKHMYEALQRNNYYMPPIKSKVITIEYLMGVRTQKYWVPSYTNLKKRPCPNPPKKRRIFEEIMAHANQHNA